MKWQDESCHFKLKSLFFKNRKQVNKSHSTDFKVQIPVSSYFFFSLSFYAFLLILSNLLIWSLYILFWVTFLTYIRTPINKVYGNLFNVYHYFTAWLFQNLIFSVPYSRTVFFTIINNAVKNIFMYKMSLNSVPYQKRNF